MITNLISDFVPVSWCCRPVLLAVNVDRVINVDLVNAVSTLMEVEVVKH